MIYGVMSTPGRIRTCDLRFRKPLLYPLSYRLTFAYQIYRKPAPPKAAVDRVLSTGCAAMFSAHRGGRP